MKWQPSGADYCEYYIAKKRVNWDSLKLHQKILPLHTLDFDGYVVREKM